MIKMRYENFLWIFVIIFTIHLGIGKELASATLEAQVLSTKSLKKLAEIVEGFIKNDYIVGAELLVIKKRNVLLHEVFGWRDKEENLLMEKNTIFNIRSMTKPLVGAACQVLIDQGKLRLSDRVSQYLVGFSNNKSASITIEQLLTHRSGLPQTIIGTSGSFQDHYDLMSLANTVGENGPKFKPGSKFSYSDAGTEVLGAVIEMVSGVSLDTFVKKHLLKPLGMKDTFFLTQRNHKSNKRIASLYGGVIKAWKRFWKPGDKVLYPFVMASQSLYSTPLDYARFLTMIMDKGLFSGRQILSSNSIKRILTPVSRMTSLGSDSPTTTGFPEYVVHYGHMMTLYILNSKEKKIADIIGHAGSDGTWAWAWPAHDLVILYFTQSRGQATGIRLETEIDRLLIRAEGDQPSYVVPADIKPYIGTYKHKTGQANSPLYKVLFYNDNLAIDVPGQMIFELNRPDKKGAWAFKIANTVSITFKKDDSNQVKEMTISELVKLPQKSRINAVDKAPKEIHPYLGSYPLPMHNQELVVQYQENNLALKDPSGKIILLSGPKNGIWTVPKDGSQIFFTKNTAGQMVLNLITNNFFLKVNDHEKK